MSIIRTGWFFLLVMQPFGGLAQEEDTSLSSLEGWDLAIAPATGVIVNGEDIYGDLGVELNSHSKGLGLTGGFSFRPGYKKVIAEKEGQSQYQYFEQKFLASFGLEKRIWLPFVLKGHARRALGGYLRLQGGYQWGNYRGTKKGVTPGFVLLPEAGITYRFQNHTLVRVGYVYFDDGLASVGDHRIALGLALSLSRSR